MSDTVLTPALLLQGYQLGIFPMSETRDSEEVFWVDPTMRGVLPLDDFHISRSLRRRLRQAPFQISFDAAFNKVVTGCANREDTWINGTIFELYTDLHDMGWAHSCEVWEGDRLVGGVYGVAIGGAFFGESMFSQVTDASKVALAYMVDRLVTCGFVLFDTQFITDHLATLGAVEIARADYHALLREALAVRALFDAQAPVPSPQDLIQRNTQTS